MKFLDAFSGIGGFRLAAMTAAKECGTTAEFVCAIEIDEKAKAVYKDNFGEDPLSDITAIAPESLPDHDVLMGGFPCPVFSKNGRHLNFGGVARASDPRTDLFERLVSILQVKRPRAYVLENVQEIASIRHYSGQVMIDHVCERIRSLGYSVSWRMLDSQDFGLAQQRKRIYISGLSSGDQVGPIDSWFNRKTVIRDIMDPQSPECLSLRMKIGKRKGASPRVLAERIISTKRNSKNDSFQYDLPLLVNAFQRAGDKERSRLELLEIAYRSRQWTRPSEPVYEIWPVAIIYGMTPSGACRQADKLYSHMGLSPTIATFSTPAIDHPMGWRILSVAECIKLQGFPSSFRVPSALGYRMLGNAVSVPVAASVVQSVLGHFA